MNTQYNIAIKTITSESTATEVTEPQKSEAVAHAKKLWECYGDMVHDCMFILPLPKRRGEKKKNSSWKLLLLNP